MSMGPAGPNPVCRGCQEQAREIERLRGGIDELRVLLEARTSELASEQVRVAKLQDAWGEIEKLRGEISRCSYHHAQPWQLPEWAKTKADLEAATNEQLNDLMGCCHAEDGDPNSKCLACYAYEVILRRE